MSLFGLAYPWLLLFNLLFIAAWIVLKRWNFTLSLFCLLLGWGHLRGFVGFGGWSNHSEGKAVKVLSFNTNSFYKLSKKPKPEVLGEFYDLIRKENPDILCFQEFTHASKWAPLIVDSLKKFIPVKGFHFSDNKLMLIVSKFPIVNQGSISFPKTSNGSIFVDLNIDGKQVRVYNLHLQSNKITLQANKLAEEGDLQEKETWDEMGSIFKKLRYNSKLRVEQAQSIAAHARKCKHPVILAGDFNDTPQSFVYQILAADMKDGFARKGRGIGTTFAGTIPALRIDYILADEGFEINAFRTIRKKISDHYPITAQLQLK